MDNATRTERPFDDELIEGICTAAISEGARRARDEAAACVACGSAVLVTTRRELEDSAMRLLIMAATDLLLARGVPFAILVER